MFPPSCLLVLSEVKLNSFFQEELRDLLRKQGKEENAKKIEIKEDQNGCIYVKVSTNDKCTAVGRAIIVPVLELSSLSLRERWALCFFFYLQHLSQYQLKSVRHMEKMMERGQQNRSVG